MKISGLLSFIVCFSIQWVYSINPFSFKSYQVEDGLSNNTVWCTMQDSYGFMWFGTSDGLNFYDGQTNKIYRNELNNKFSIENNYIQTLLELENHDILVGTNRGIYLYDRKNEYFYGFDKRTQYGVSISSEVKKIIKADNGLLWIATIGQGVFIYDPSTDELIQNSSYTPFVCDVIQKKDRSICIASLHQGLFLLDDKGHLLREYKLKEIYEDRDDYRVNCISEIDNNIWIGIVDNKLLKLENSGKVEEYPINSYNVESIQSLMEYNTDQILVGTDEGLYLFNYNTYQFIRIDNPENTEAMTDQSVNAITRDIEGGVWISTNLGGVNYFTKSNKQFYSFIPDKEKGTSKVIGPFCEDSSGKIWIGTRRGLANFDTKNQTLIYSDIGKINEKKHDIRSLIIHEDEIWIGTYGSGLIRMNIHTGRNKQYTYSNEIPNSICGDEVLSLHETRNGTIYIGTSWGLCSYNKEEDNFYTITTIGMMVSVVDIHEDMYGNLWVGTSNSGVFRLNTINGHWKHFHHEVDNPHSIISSSIITLFEDSKGIMWFGTNGRGLCFFDKETETFIDFDPNNNLIPNKVIYAIEEDNAGDFWISTNAGLVKLNPTSKNIPRRFTAKDGLQSNQFNFRSSFKSSDEWLFFGGINGFSMFQPNTFTDNKYIPPVYITRIEFPYSDETDINKILKTNAPVYLSDEITIPYINNSFSLKFASLSYEAPDNNYYSYILNGTDREWVINKTNNTVSYTDLPPGKYVFEVRGSNNDNVWNEQPAKLTIIILPPWWKSTLAYIVYSFLLAGIIYYLAWRFNFYVKQKYKRRMKQFQMDKEREIYESKIKFFINLVHEIRTPLSLIKLPLDKLQEQKPEGNEKKYLSLIDRHVNYLLNTTNELLDFQKMESGSMEYKMKKCNINQTVENSYLQFKESAGLKGIELLLKMPEENIVSVIDNDKAQKILVNLISNAIKYARKEIEIKLEYNEEHISISVMDDGPGIVAEERDKIFKAFYQVNDGISNGTGIGLAFSQSLAEGLGGKLIVQESLSGGSVFKLLLPFQVGESTIEAPATSIEIVPSINSEEKEDDQYILPLHKFTIMLVEDNIELLNLMKESLSEWFTILTAQHGQEAVLLLNTENPDIIISDIMMPGMNGLELCKYIKTNITYSHIPVILLTAKTTLESKAEGFDSGADAYIEKPFTIKQLHKQVENLLKLRVAYHQMMLNLFQNDVPDIQNILSNKERELIVQITSAIEKQMADENFSIDTLAETLHMSRSNFYRKIKAITGMAPNDYLKEVRLNKAARLLQQGERVSDVYHQVGFSTSSYFSKCFKIKYGTAPNQWIKDQQTSPGS